MKQGFPNFFWILTSTTAMEIPMIGDPSVSHYVTQKIVKKTKRGIKQIVSDGKSKVMDGRLNALINRSPT
jgi:hypothetical protein